MQTRQLANTGVQVSPLCLGAMMFGAWGETDHDESIRIIHAALDAGINFIDTADVYSRGESEEIVGKALATRRDSVFLATKVHGKMDDDDPNYFGNSRRWIVKEVENSLRRLRHRPHRPLPDPPPRARHRHRRDALGAQRPRHRRQGPLHRLLDLPAVGRGRGAVGRREARPPALRHRAAAVLDPRPRDRARPPPHLRALRHGRAALVPARRRLADRQVPKGRRGAEVAPGGDGPRPLRHVEAREPGEARGRRRARRARRGGRADDDRDVARLPASSTRR